MAKRLTARSYAARKYGLKKAARFLEEIKPIPDHPGYFALMPDFDFVEKIEWKSRL